MLENQVQENSYSVPREQNIEKSETDIFLDGTHKKRRRELKCFELDEKDSKIFHLINTVTFLKKGLKDSMFLLVLIGSGMAIFFMLIGMIFENVLFDIIGLIMFVIFFDKNGNIIHMMIARRKQAASIDLSDYAFVKFIDTLKGADENFVRFETAEIPNNTYVHSKIKNYGWNNMKEKEKSFIGILAVNDEGTMFLVNLFLLDDYNKAYKKRGRFLRKRRKRYKIS